MTLSPFEVERREFGSAPMGYKKRDVDTFLDEIQRSLRDLWQERGDVREENERLKERLARFEQLEDQLKSTLLLAQDSAEKAQEQARRESELVMREAGQKSRDLLHQAHEDKQRLEMVLRDLQGAEQEARQRLRSMSNAILSHLDDTEALVAESTGAFRAIVQAHPEASEIRSSGEEAAPTAVEPTATDPVRVDVTEAGRASERLAEAEAAVLRRTDNLDTGVASSETADAFFGTPPTFDAAEVAERRVVATGAGETDGASDERTESK